MSSRRLRCHRCRSTDLTVNEVCHEFGSFDEIYVSDTGSIESHGVGIFSAGDIQPELTRVHCHDCGHDWHPRRPFVGVSPEFNEA